MNETEIANAKVAAKKVADDILSVPVPTPEGKPPLRIVSLQAENVKRLVAVSITPTGNVVEIAGKNGAGKTSILDSIWWALAGVKNVQKSPIRNGQEKARIRLDMGELIATRTFTRTEDGSYSTSIVVESADGGRLKSPQAALDALLGELAFDPLEFSRMKPKEQFDTLKAFVPGVNFDTIENLNRTDFDNRAKINREAKEKASQAAAISIPDSTPAKRVDEAAIVDEIGQVGEFNAEIERRKERRETAKTEAAGLRDNAQVQREKAEGLRAQAIAADQAADAMVAKAEDLEKKLTEAPPLDEPKDVAEVRARLETAKRTNVAVENATKRATLLAEAEELGKQSKALTERMEKREEEKRTAIAAAKLPVEGITFAEESILLNGVPFDQASDAEQLRASCAIAMANNPRLRVIRVRDGSLLDEDGMAILATMAAERDFQVWCERVDSSGKVGFVIEDGHVRATPEAAAPATQAAE